MNKPIDPRKHGLNEPQKILSRKEEFFLPVSTKTYPIKFYLPTLFDIWEGILFELKIINGIVIEGPYINPRNEVIEYTWQQDNLNYSEEMSRYSAAMNEYAEEMRKWEEFKKSEKSKSYEDLLKDEQRLNKQILRAEHRLANLKAVKAGDPIPFPDND